MEDLLLYLIKASGLIGLFYFAYMLLLRKETFFSGNRWFLIFGLISSSILPLFFITKIIWVEPTTDSFDWSNIPVTASVSNPESKINWYLIGMYTYLTGILISFIQLVFDFYSLMKVLKGKNIQQNGNFKFIDIAENIAPFSYFNYIVYNSSLYSSDELKNILEHEKVHSQQKHSLDVLISRLFCVFFWFNPLIWLYKKAIVQNLEFIADSEASKNITDKKAYQLTLLKITTQDNCVTITNHFYQSLIKKRIIMLNQNQSKKWHSWKYITVFPALIAFVFLFQIEVIAQERETQKPENETKSETVDLKSFQLEKDLKTLSEDKEIIINGEKSSQEELDKLDPKGIEKIDVATISGKKTILVTTKQLLKPVKITDKTIYIDGVKSTKEELEKLDKNSIDKMDVNTLDNTVKITTKTIAKLDDKNVIRTISSQDGIKPLIIIDGNQADSNFKIDELPTDRIESINVLKGIHAVTKYGEKAKDGVIEIKTKEKTTLNNFKPIQRKTFQGFQILKPEETKNIEIEKINENPNKKIIKSYLKEYYIDGKKSTAFVYSKLDINNIDKVETDPFKKKVFITTKTSNAPKSTIISEQNGNNNAIAKVNAENKNSTLLDFTKTFSKALVIIDGKKSNLERLLKIKNRNIKFTNANIFEESTDESKKIVLATYGEKARNGVLVVETSPIEK
ncbi:M56 family metallopeptidase [Flavobacterium daejeonense]|uniref:M56 family metallopeptidase n=1 Tax=Flavobacterium daejeonense TaxID=350893 RepID=UPI000691D911|nr:M56 family metallopeptidase [Flavobacterium daejeonense]